MPDLLPIRWRPGFIFLAAIVRGYSGFGFSLLAITALSLIFAPAQVIPAIFMLEIAASLHMLPSIWRDVHWRSLAVLLTGTHHRHARSASILWPMCRRPPMTLALAVFVLAATFLLWRGFALKTMPSAAGHARGRARRRASPMAPSASAGRR